LQDGPFVVLNADVLTDIDLPSVWCWHNQRNALVTMVVRPDPAARQYGAVLVDGDDHVRCINGRPDIPTAEAGEEMIFTGVQVISPPVLDRIPPERFVSTTAEVYPALVAANNAVYGYRHTGYWLDIGVPERYRQAHWDMLNGRRGDDWIRHLPVDARVVLVTPPSGEQNTVPPVVLGPGVELAPTARVGPYAVLGPGCRLEGGAVVQESVLGEGVRVGAGATVTRCILGPGTQVQAASVLCDTLRST
jgi:NDP-sugar pyrophosphorylase family protein